MTLDAARRTELLARAPRSMHWRRLIRAIAAALLQAVVAVRRRRELARLSDLDDRLLADIGLRRGDLRDAHSVPLFQDPTSILKRHSDLGAQPRSMTRAPTAGTHAPVDHAGRGLMAHRSND